MKDSAGAARKRTLNGDWWLATVHGNEFRVSGKHSVPFHRLKFGLSLRSIFVVVIYFKRVISLCRILIHHLCQLLLRVSDGFCEDKLNLRADSTFQGNLLHMPTPVG